MSTLRRGTLSEQLADASASCSDVEALAGAVFAVVARHVPFVFACMATTDPATEMIGRAFKSAPLPMGNEGFAAVEYGEPDINQLVEIARRPVPVGALWLDTDGHPERCRRMRDYMTPLFGFTDELRVVCRSRDTSWALLAIYRGPQESPFTPLEADALAGIGELIADRVQSVLFADDAPVGQLGAAGGDSAVVIVDADNRVSNMSATLAAHIDDLGGRDATGALPDTLLVVASQARTRRGSASTRVRGRGGCWLEVQAMALDGPVGRCSVVVTIAAAAPASVGEMALTARGLTSREQDVARLVLQGASTKDIAGSLFLSPHTVQDHLKSIFRKLGVTSRRELIAQLVLTTQPAAAGSRSD